MVSWSQHYGHNERCIGPLTIFRRLLKFVADLQATRTRSTKRERKCKQKWWEFDLQREWMGRGLFIVGRWSIESSLLFLNRHHYFSHFIHHHQCNNFLLTISFIFTSSSDFFFIIIIIFSFFESGFFILFLFLLFTSSNMFIWLPHV